MEGGEGGIHPPGFQVTVTARLRHGMLWEARRKLGSTKALAKALGVSYHTCLRWVNLQGKPWPELIQSRRWPRIQRNLFELTGGLPEELFPAGMTQDFLDQPKSLELVREIPLAALGDGTLGLRALPAPDEVLEAKELEVAVQDALKLLTAREEKVMRLRFGLNGEDPMTLKEVGALFGVTVERIRQIEAMALRKLRHPTRNSQIKEAAGLPVEGEG